MYIPTNSLVSIIAAYAEDPQVQEKLKSIDIPDFWSNKSKAQQFLSSTPLYLQLSQQPPRIGKRRGGPTARALETAAPAYEIINKLASQGSGFSDKVFNRAFAAALSEAFEDSGYEFKAESNHPWLSTMTPDVLISQDTKDTICLEFHYTANKAPNQIASYVLRKLNTYMNQIEDMYNSGKQLLL